MALSDAGEASAVTGTYKEVPWISNSRQSSPRRLGAACGAASPPMLSREASPKRRSGGEVPSASSVHAPASGRDGHGLEGELDEVGVPEWTQASNEDELVPVTQTSVESKCSIGAPSP